MKLEKLFEVKDSKLYKIGESEIFTPNVKSVKWSEVEGNPEEYNEDFLATLRDELKSLEERNEFVVIEPEFDKDATTEQFTAAMKHTARRIKDCISVIGFAIPEQISKNAETLNFYIEEMSAKHKQYCYFSKSNINGDIAIQ